MPILRPIEHQYPDLSFEVVPPRHLVHRGKDVFCRETAVSVGDGPEDGQLDGYGRAVGLIERSCRTFFYLAGTKHFFLRNAVNVSIVHICDYVL